MRSAFVVRAGQKRDNMRAVATDKTYGGATMIEYEKKPASGTAKTALGLSIGALGAELLGGTLGNLMGNGMGTNVVNSDCMHVNRYELGLVQSNNALANENALLKADKYTDMKFADLNDRYNERFRTIEQQLAVQAVTNQRTADSFEVAQRDLMAVKNELDNKIKMEAERRCCADNSIVSYVNSTFYPRQTADVTVGTTSTAQALYNPIPNCGCGCNK